MSETRRTCVVTGTGTGVGKTWVTARLCEELIARGTTVAARKPVQSFDPADGPTDADVLAAATGERVDNVCPPARWLPKPLAPPLAARVLGLEPFTIGDLVEPLRTADAAWTFIEGAGGPLSPLAADGDTRTLIDTVAPDRILIVSDAGLGAINSVRLTLEALAGRSRGLVFLNRYDGSEVQSLNAEVLANDAAVFTDVSALGDAFMDGS